MHRLSAPPERPFRPSQKKRISAPPPPEPEKKLSSGYGSRASFTPLRTTAPRMSKKDLARTEMLFDAMLRDHGADRDSPTRASPRAAEAARGDEPAWAGRGRDFSFGDVDDRSDEWSDGDGDDDDASYDAAEDWWRRHNAGETVRAAPAARPSRPEEPPAAAEAEKVRGERAHAKWEGPPPAADRPRTRSRRASPRADASTRAAARRPPAKSARKTTLDDVLGVKIHAERAEIKRAYVDLALKLHPDKNKDASANAQFLRVKEAYSTLANADDRRAYDRALVDARGAG
ncbi:DnaJ-like protein [Aureococcus anophagefferens]|nr:DnaJ-like protein [Aureococcus anophagefferens]